VLIRITAGWLFSPSSWSPRIRGRGFVSGGDDVRFVEREAHVGRTFDVGIFSFIQDDRGLGFVSRRGGDGGSVRRGFAAAAADRSTEQSTGWGDSRS
jgi:hypothetical protein